MQYYTRTVYTSIHIELSTYTNLLGSTRGKLLASVWHLFLKFSALWSMHLNLIFHHLSSLHSIIFNSFGLLFLLWSLLAQARLSFRVVIVVQKSYSGD